MINTLEDRLERFTNTPLYPILFCVLSILSYSIPILEYFYLFVFVLGCFVPLFTKKETDYIPLLFFPFIQINNEHFKVLNLNLLSLIEISLTFISIIVFLLISKAKFKFGRLFIPFFTLAILYLFSTIVSLGFGESISSTPLLYIAGLFFILIAYSLSSTLFSLKSNTFDDFCNYCSYFAITIFIITSIYYIKNPAEFCTTTSTRINLFGLTNKVAANTIVLMLVPICAINIYRKNLLGCFAFLAAIATSIFMLTESGISILILAVIPIIFIAFRSYRRLAPYIYVSASFVIIFILILLIYLNKSFLQEVLDSFKLFNLADNINTVSFKDGLNYFLENPVIGVSVLTIYNDFNFINTFSNNTLAIMAATGSLGIVCLLIHEINIYALCFQRKTHHKWLIFTLLLMLDLISLNSETFTNPIIMFFLLITFSSYQNSNVADPVKVNRNPFIQAQYN